MLTRLLQRSIFGLQSMDATVEMQVSRPIAEGIEPPLRALLQPAYSRPNCFNIASAR